MVETFKLVPNDVTQALLEDIEFIKQRILEGETRAFALVEVKKNHAAATMWAMPEVSNLTANVLISGVCQLKNRLIQKELELLLPDESHGV